MNVTITYADEDIIQVDPDDIADNLDVDADEETIKNAIKAHISTGASEQPWPSYKVDSDDMSDVLRFVKSKLLKRAQEEEDEAANGP